MWQAGDMNYSIEFLGTAGADDAPASGGRTTGSSASLAGAVEQAERLVAQSGQGEAVISREPDKASGGRAGAEIARYSADGGWRSEAITPASWWARLSLPTKEKLKAHPRAELPREVWDEVSEAGGAVIGARRPGPDAGASDQKLPADLADFIESEQPKL
jgi:hypothetical protein